jgi:hypothetical protein
LIIVIIIIIYLIQILGLYNRFLNGLDPRGAHDDFRGKTGFGTVDQEERGLPGGSAGCCPVPP